MNKLCANCGKPVYFAERKSSLGKDWHRACLKCKECGKVLSPGQHAEHKGQPFCHNPCYKALFGPSMLGYGSNISSPANFLRRDQATSQSTDYSHGNGYKREIITYHNQTVKNTKQEQSHTKKLISQPSPSNTLPKAGTASLSQAENHHSGSKLKNGISQEMREILQKVDEFNKFHEGKVHHQMTVQEKPDGSAFVEGPLRIYWGLSRPIQLVHCDNIPPAPISQWRHSLHVGPDSPSIPNRGLSNTLSLRRTGSPPRKFKDTDNPLLSPASDDVVRRKKKTVRKFKTVAYRGDQPTKWKRASINGHVFNFDTSVFTPVLGSCTSVTVDSSLNSSEVIETLLDKFKVQNSPDEYVLSVVSENDERLLTSWDKPLIERLKLGPDEAAAKIFIKEREPEQEVIAEDSSISMPIQETPESENLPHEVEQLLVLPEAVLKGILVKFQRDEENEISLVKARYETVRKRMQKRLGELQRQSYQSSSKV